MSSLVLRPFWLLLLVILLPTSAEAQGAPRQPLLIAGKQSLFQRVIVRPGALISPQADPQGAKPVPGFTVFYVYSRQGGDTGWLEVGRTSDGRIEGWLPAAKAIDWKHTMVGAFSNPAGRHPVLFLGSERDERILMLDGEAGAAAERLRAAAVARQNSPVVAIEPDRFVDITHQFYLMPILHAERIEREIGPPLRLLEVVSAVADPPPPPPADPAALRNFKAGVVFVLDTTMSMEPYIERTRDAVKAIVARIGDTAMRDNFRFGMVVYRDSLEDSPGLEYATRVVAKPDFSQPPSSIIPPMAEVRDSRVSSIGFDEDPVAGLKTAIDEIDWNAFSGRYIVLVTDAGARPSTHPHSVTRLGIPEIAALAKSKGIAVFAIHLLTPEGRARHDHEPARAQYEELSRFGAAGSLYYPVPNGAPDAFARTVDGISTSLLQQVVEATGRPVAGLSPSTPAAGARMQEQMKVVGEAMKLAYLGRVENTQAPDVVHGWTTDRDLTDPTIASLDVRVLLTRNQLSDLANALQGILRAGLAGRTEPQTFFTQLRSTFAAAARDPQRIAQAQKIGAMLGEYLDDLPYQSEIMDITEADWLAMGAIAQRTVLNNVESRLRLYQEFQAETDHWVDLTGGRNPGEAMFPVPIEALP